MKRLFDIIFSFVLLVCFTPILLIIGILIFLQDYRSPFYIAKRVGKNSNLFKRVAIVFNVSNLPSILGM